ncbi:hypothetical protein [Streptomyces sp. URMC 123]|uniref:hypothetical protein n=1 Tax=Streptomyces sp. URMC 123 TaxID=3423403 RepID=UPI003F19FD4F
MPYPCRLRPPGIGRACSRDRKGPEGRRPWLIDAGDAARDFPRIIQDHVAIASDETLDEEAVYLARKGLRPCGEFWPDLAAHYGIGEKDAARFHAGLIGTRAYPYQHRPDQAAGRPLVSVEHGLA